MWRTSRRKARRLGISASIRVESGCSPPTRVPTASWCSGSTRRPARSKRMEQRSKLPRRCALSFWKQSRFEQVPKFTFEDGGAIEGLEHFLKEIEAFGG